MTRDRTPATAAQAKALSSPIRLRILRLCLHQELTNQQLATRLGCDPSTLHYHARILLEAGILERAEPRHGPTGALEKPYRSTGQSWTLDIGTDNANAAVAMVDAFRAELTEAGPGSIKSSSRFVLHLDDTTREELLQRIQSLLDEYETTDDERRAEHQPRFGGLFIINELASSE